MDHAKIKQVMYLIGGRSCMKPEYLRRRMEGIELSKHSFTFRVEGKLVVWFEVWSNHAGVIDSKYKEALEISKRGFKVAFLPTYLSVRKVGQRRPCLITPIEKSFDLKLIAEHLKTAGYVGP